MKYIFFLHWNETELMEKIQPLKNAGYKVNYHFTPGVAANISNPLPDILIICLDRLPSHGKAYAKWFWEAKKRWHIPIVFCGGKPEKVLPIKEKFQKAVFCDNENLLKTIIELS